MTSVQIMTVITCVWQQTYMYDFCVDDGRHHKWFEREIHNDGYVDHGRQCMCVLKQTYMHDFCVDHGRHHMCFKREIHDNCFVVSL